MHPTSDIDEALVRPARAEFIEAAAWYENQRPRLGVEFIAETGRCVYAAAERPGSAPLLDGGCHIITGDSYKSHANHRDRHPEHGPDRPWRLDQQLLSGRALLRRRHFVADIVANSPAPAAVSPPAIRA